MYILLAIHENLRYENSLFILHLNVTDAEFSTLISLDFYDDFMNFNGEKDFQFLHKIL